MRATTPKPPKAKIQRMHSLIDEALGIWQSDVGPWIDQLDVDPVPDGWFSRSRFDDDLHDVHTALRELRVSIESDDASTVRAGGKIAT